jgi:hypothetical protein
MPQDSGASVSVVNLDGNMVSAAVALDTTYVDSANSIDCSGYYACYKITHTESAQIPAGTELKFRIQGPSNAISVQTAGLFHVQTRLLEGGSYYQIDYAALPSVNSTGGEFVTRVGSIGSGSSTQEALNGSSLVCYESNVRYTIPF